MLASRLPLATGPGLLLTLATFWFLWVAINLPLDIRPGEPAYEIDFKRDKVDLHPAVKPPPPERVKPLLEPPQALGPATPIKVPPVRPARVEHPARQGGHGTVGLPPPGGPMIGSGIDHGPEVLFRPEPDYPGSALRRGIEGRVIVQFSVLASGQVADVSVIAADPPGVFDAAAIAAVNRWRYRPAVADGSAVASVGLRAAIVFELPKD